MSESLPCLFQRCPSSHTSSHLNFEAWRQPVSSLPPLETLKTTWQASRVCGWNQPKGRCRVSATSARRAVCPLISRAGVGFYKSFLADGTGNQCPSLPRLFAFPSCLPSETLFLGPISFSEDSTSPLSRPRHRPDALSASVSRGQPSIPLPCANRRHEPGFYLPAAATVSCQLSIRLPAHFRFHLSHPCFTRIATKIAQLGHHEQC